MLVSLQYARAIASLLVVYAHLGGFPFFQSIAFDTEIGGMGVDIFFVISGYIMWQTAQKQSTGDFLVRRFARIAPAYWFYTMLLVGIATFLPTLTRRIHFDTSEVVMSLLFVPYANSNGEINPILLQGWTLNYEVYFYLIFALSLLVTNLKLRFWLVLAGLIITAVVGYEFGDRAAAARFYGSSILLEFALGMGLSAIGRWQPNSPPFLSICAVALSILLFWLATSFGNDMPRIVLFGVPAAVFLFGLTRLEPLLSAKPSKLLVAIGDSSYSLYLCHPFILSAVYKAIAGLTTGFSAVSTAVIFGISAVAVSLVVAYLSFLFLERPSSRAVLALWANARGMPLPGSFLKSRHDIPSPKSPE